MINVLFLGTPKFSADALEALVQSDFIRVGAVITQPDRKSGRGEVLSPSPVKSVALHHDIPVLQPHSVRKEMKALSGELESYGPFDIGVVIAFGQILPSSFLEFPSHGCVNVHASLLPRWRGAAPIQRAIMAGDTETGICFMDMDKGLDTGPVYKELRVPIEENETAGELFEKLSQLTNKTLPQALLEIVNGEVQAIAQSETGVSYASKIENSEAEIQWSDKAEKVLHLIHGLSPVPGAFSTYLGKRIKIFRASLTSNPPGDENRQEPLQPGQIVCTPSRELFVSCQDGFLQLLDVQLAGKKRMEAKQFVIGHQIRSGVRFGE